MSMPGASTYSARRSLFEFGVQYDWGLIERNRTGLIAYEN